jgi:NAD-dependent dihydropyrimidine dehydrogenase PreA subunit
MASEYYLEPAEVQASRPIIFDGEKCIGCNRCMEICQVDIFVPNPEEGKPPLVLFPGECWYCGCCVMVCPCDGAITLRHPLMNRVHWVDKKELLKGSSC